MMPQALWELPFLASADLGPPRFARPQEAIDLLRGPTEEFLRDFRVHGIIIPVRKICRFPWGTTVTLKGMDRLVLGRCPACRAFARLMKGYPWYETVTVCIRSKLRMSWQPLGNFSIACPKWTGGDPPTAARKRLMRLWGDHPTSQSVLRAGPLIQCLDEDKAGAILGAVFEAYVYDRLHPDPDYTMGIWQAVELFASDAVKKQLSNL